MDRFPDNKMDRTKGRAVENLDEKTSGQGPGEPDPFDLCGDEDLFYWMQRDEVANLEPLSYLGTSFPSGCRFCI